MLSIAQDALIYFYYWCIQELRFQSAHQSKDDVNKFLRKVMALPFLYLYPRNWPWKWLSLHLNSLWSILLKVTCSILWTLAFQTQRKVCPGNRCHLFPAFRRVRLTTSLFCFLFSISKIITQLSSPWAQIHHYSTISYDVFDYYLFVCLFFFNKSARVSVRVII